jgi:dipeptidyl aminopeptidase/acylaminoacyl peptidase
MQGLAMTIERLLTLRRPTDLAISADGDRIAVTVLESGGGDPKRGTAEPWTPPDGLYTTPRWSPVHRELALCSDREHRGLMSLYTLDGPDADPSELGSIDGSVEEIAWSSDGLTLLVLAADLGLDTASAHNATPIQHAGRSLPDPLVLHPDAYRRRLFAVDRLTGETRELPFDELSVWSFGWDGESRVAAIASADSSESGWYTASLVVLRTGPSIEVESRYEPTWQLGAPRVSPDGRRLAFIEGICSDRGIVAGSPMIADLEARELAPGCLNNALDVTELQWRDTESLWYAGWDRAGSACGTISLAGEVGELWRGDATLGSRLRAEICADAAGRRLIAIKEAANVPPEVMSLEGVARDQWVPLTDFNRGLTRLRLPRWETLRWVSSDNLEIEGLLALPGDRRAEQLPLVVLLHGGPSSSWTYQWTNFGWPTLWTGAGYAVLMPNPRGSVGYGQPFARATRHDMGGGELQDVIAGIDVTIASGVADPDRIGVLGASHGGYLATWAMTQTNRFAAGIAIAAPCNRLSKYNTGNIGYLEELFWDPDPYDPTGAVISRSPIACVRDLQSPLLIFHGELDRCVPVSQALELYNGLVREDRTEVELVIYAREGHTIRERKHLIDFWARARAWFARHVARVAP